MLGQVSSNQDNKFIKPVEVRDLSMRTNNIPIDNLDHTEVLQQLDGTPKGSFAAPWLIRDLRLFWICRAIVGIESEQPESYFSLSSCEAKNLVKAVPYIVKLSKIERRR